MSVNEQVTQALEVANGSSIPHLHDFVSTLLNTLLVKVKNQRAQHLNDFRNATQAVAKDKNDGRH